MKMIIDSGESMSIMSYRWLENYLEGIGIAIEQVETKNCFRKFRFGENIYTSIREVTIPIMVQALDSTPFKREELFLCGIRTLVDWFLVEVWGKTFYGNILATVGKPPEDNYTV